MKTTKGKHRFFKPFVGKKYKDGINGKKVLVIGASFYCSNTSLDCFKKCTDANIKDSSPYDDQCPIYNKDLSTKHHNNKKLLHDEPTHCIYDKPRTLRIFAKYMSKWCESSEYSKVWEYMAFTNYVQFFLPAKPNAFRATNMSDLSERDFIAFNETLEELDPDIVIIWGCTINKRIRENNEYLVSMDELDKSEWYVCHIKVPWINHQIVLINPYHPSSSAWHDKLDIFDKYLSLELYK